VSYTDSYGPDPDGDPIQSANGGQVIDMHFVLPGDADMASGLADIPSAGSGRSVPPGPCA
jgi:hypothetical protein